MGHVPEAVLKTTLSPHTEGDELLVAKAKAGDHRAFEKLLKKYQRPLYFTIRKMVLRHEDTDDILQETFVKVYHSLSRFTDGEPFYPWLYRIAVNTALNYRKRAFRQHEVSLGELMNEEKDPFPSEERDSLDEVLHNELEGKIAAALEQLPFDQRAVLVLRASAELSYEEISRALGINIGTVMSRLARAREKMRWLLKDYLEV